MDYSAMLQRVVRAVTFDQKFYNEAKYDARLNQEALIVVIAATVLSGLGALFSGLIPFLITVVMSVAGYYLLSYFITIVGRNFFNGQGTQEQVQRLIGYAWAPRALGLLSWIPCIGWLVGLVAMLWSVAIAVVAVREAHEFDTTKAIITAVGGWLIVMVLTGLLGLLFGAGWVGLGALG